MAVQLAADLRSSADGSAVRTSLVQPAVAKLQAASVLIARAAAPWDRETDGRIAVSLNAPPYGTTSRPSHAMRSLVTRVVVTVLSIHCLQQIYDG